MWGKACGVPSMACRILAFPRQNSKRSLLHYILLLRKTGKVRNLKTFFNFFFFFLSMHSGMQQITSGEKCHYSQHLSLRTDKVMTNCVCCLLKTIDTMSCYVFEQLVYATSTISLI